MELEPGSRHLEGPRICLLPGTVRFISHATCLARQHLVLEIVLSDCTNLAWPIPYKRGNSVREVLKGWHLCLLCPSWVPRVAGKRLKLTWGIGRPISATHISNPGWTIHDPVSGRNMLWTTNSRQRARDWLGKLEAQVAKLRREA